MQRYRARFIISDGQTIDNGVLTVDGGKIVNISEGDYDTDLGDVIVVPGLVNAHSMLFSAACGVARSIWIKGTRAMTFGAGVRLCIRRLRDKRPN